MPQREYPISRAATPFACFGDWCRRGKDGDAPLIDILNILFIAGGAFTGLDKVLTHRRKPGRTGIGFHAQAEAEGPDTTRIHSETDPDELRHFGLVPEFIGRFPIIAALHDLGEAALVHILTEPRNALVHQHQKLFPFEGVVPEFDPEALTTIARRTMARGLRSLLEGML